MIEERLKSAKAVVVLWSAGSSEIPMGQGGSRRRANGRELVQAILDGTIPPMPFNQIQCADLTGWSGDINAPGWRKLSASVAALAGRNPAVSN